MTHLAVYMAGVVCGIATAFVALAIAENWAVRR